MRRLWPVVAVLAGVLLGAPPGAGACSCVDRSFQEQLASAAVAFTGIARRIETTGSVVSVRFDVAAVYKGQAQRRVAVQTPSGSAACGVGFRAGKHYVVLAASEGTAFTTTVCSGTTDDASVVAGLTPVTRYDVAPPPPRGEPAQRSFPVGVAAGAFALVVAGVVWIWMLRSRPRPLV